MARDWKYHLKLYPTSPSSLWEPMRVVYEYGSLTGRISIVLNYGAILLAWWFGEPSHMMLVTIIVVQVALRVSSVISAEHSAVTCRLLLARHNKCFSGISPSLPNFIVWPITRFITNWPYMGSSGTRVWIAEKYPGSWSSFTAFWTNMLQNSTQNMYVWKPDRISTRI